MAAEGTAGQRDALIIATEHYQDPEFSTLRSPSQDAHELAAVLEDQAIGGFRAQILLNQPGSLLSEEIEGFLANRASPSSAWAPTSAPATTSAAA